MDWKNLFIRNLEAADFFENFFVSAVVSILGIRFYLHLTGYPQIGGDGLHIAHMLWGGLFMLLAILIMMGFLNRLSFLIASMLAGMGFGTFIDEIGKFITKDNNYFFEPTVSIIYVIFVLLYLGIHLISRRDKFTKHTYLLNALESMKEAVLRQMDEEERDRTRRYLRKSDPHQPLVIAFLEILDKLEINEKEKPNIIDKLTVWVHHHYMRLIRLSVVQKAILTFFVLQALVTLASSILLTGVLTGHFNFAKIIYEHLSFGEYGDLIFSTISGFIVILGVIKMRTSRIEAFKLFKTSVLISLFLTQFFIFYDIQFRALWGFAFDLVLLFTLNSMINQEMINMRRNRNKQTKKIEVSAA